MKRLLLVPAVVMVFMFLLLGSAVTAQDFCKGNFDYDKDVDGSDASTFKQDFGRSQFQDPCPPDGPAPVERTSQSPIYAIGDDGYHHKGVIWPGGGMRFNDNGNGTVTDNLTGLIWLKNANCFGAQTWDWALLVSNSLSEGGCGLTDGSSIGDWRLPNVKELTSLIDYDFYDPALGYPFPNVQSFSYWTSTTLATFTDHAWYVQMVNGGVGTYNKSVYVNVWPVRGGHPY